jgi:hypothetical protein
MICSSVKRLRFMGRPPVVEDSSLDWRSFRGARQRPISYDDLKDKHSMNMRHQEILALAKLYGHGPTPDFDDRAAAIEVQIEEDVTLALDNLIGIVIPDQYLHDPDLKRAFKSMTQHVETYRHFPLDQNQHYSVVYEAVERIYKRSGVRI